MPLETIHPLPIHQIDSRPQVRREFDEVAQAELARSIQEVGVQQPIRVRRVGERFVILLGERRWRASKLAGLTTIPAIIEERELDAGQITQLQLIENIQRSDLSPLEKASALQEMMADGSLTATQAAAKVGWSLPNVTKLLPLLGLSEPIRAAIAAGTISASAGYELSLVTDPERQAALATKLTEGHLTRDALTGLRKAANQRPPAVTTGANTAAAAAAAPQRKVRLSLPLDAQRSITLAGPGLTSLDPLIAWLEELLAKARKARPQNLALPTFVRLLKDQASA